jgi:phosphoglycolate phosphatase
LKRALSKPLAGVLFDKDGTLVDFDLTWGPAVHAMILALARGDAARIRAQADALHFSVEDKRFRMTSPIVAGSTADYGHVWAEALGRSDLETVKREIDSLSAVQSLKALTPIGEPLAVFAALRALGLRLGVATNDSEQSARRQVEALGIGAHVEFVAGYDSGHGGKPDPGMALAFARFLEADASQIVMVGDSRHDLDCARAAGAVAVAVLSGPAKRGALEPHADFVIDHIGDLPRLLAEFVGPAGRSRTDGSGPTTIA